MRKSVDTPKSLRLEFIDWLFSGEDIEHGIFNGLILKNLNFHKTKFFDCSFKSASLAGANLAECEFVDCRFHSANFEGAILKNALFKDCCFDNANFGSNNFDGIGLVRCSLRGSALEGYICQLRGSMHSVTVCNPIVHVGCMSLPIDEWLHQYEELGRLSGYSLAEVDEYGEYLKAAKSFIDAANRRRNATP